MTSINRTYGFSAALDLLDKIYADPSNIESACNDYNALRRNEKYADIEEEIEDAIGTLPLDLIWEAVGPDAYDQHYAVGMQARKPICDLLPPIRSRGREMIKTDYKYLADAPPKSTTNDTVSVVLVCVVFILISIDWDSIPVGG
jgi:hypothetical protein